MHFDPLTLGTAQCSDVLEVHSPHDGSLVGTIGQSDGDAVHQALKVADSTFKDRGNWLPVHERVAVLRRLAEAMADEAEQLAATATLEGGKPITDSRIEVARAVDGVHLALETIRGGDAQPVALSGTAAGADRLGFTIREPIGPVVAVSAFNHPVNLIVHQVVAAVAAGCPVIVKPADDTPLSCFRLVELLHAAGLPPQWCQAIVTTDLDVAEALVTDRRVAFFSFIGSARVGWSLRSKLSAGTRCALEHGGAAPVIVAGDTDLDAAIPLLTTGGFYHAGQVCVSVQRILALDGIGDELTARLAESASELVVGDPSESDTRVGPLIRPREVERVNRWVTEAVAAGAELVTGGAPASQTAYQPTVLRNPPRNATVSTSEIFGPVVCVYDHDSLDDALAQANELPWQFQAAVFTTNTETAMAAYSGLRASTVLVNDHSAFRVDNMPFAGLNQSGLGTGGIKFTIADMQIDKLVILRK